MQGYVMAPIDSSSSFLCIMFNISLNVQNKIPVCFMLVSHWRRRRGDVAATPATDQSRRLRRLVKPKIASTHTRATSPRPHRDRCVRKSRRLLHEVAN